MEFTDLNELKKLMAGGHNEFEFEEDGVGDLGRSIEKDGIFSLGRSMVFG